MRNSLCLSTVLFVSIASFISLPLGGCAVRQESKTLPVFQVESAKHAYHGTQTPVSVGKFENHSSFMRGIFTDNVDRLGQQAKNILITHLQQTGRFSVQDRNNMSEIEQEAKFQKKAQSIKGSDFVITGGVTEFGRKEIGDRQLFGVLGRSKKQIAYAKVNINIVNTHTSQVVLSSQGAGEYSLSDREIIGFGGTAHYDATLNGKVLELAIRDAVNNLITGIDGKKDALHP